MENVLGSPLFFVVLGEGVIILLLFGVVLYQCCAAHGRRKTQPMMYAPEPHEDDFNSKGTPDDPFARYMAGCRPIRLQDQEAQSTASTARSSGSRPPFLTTQVHPHELDHLAGNLATHDLYHRARSSDRRSVETSGLISSGRGHIATPSAVHLRPGAPTPLSASSVFNAYGVDDEAERTTAGEGGGYVHEHLYYAAVSSDSLASGTFGNIPQTPPTLSHTPRPILDIDLQNSPSTSLRQLLEAAQHGGHAPVYPFLLRSGLSTSEAHSAESGHAAGVVAAERVGLYNIGQGGAEPELGRERRSSRKSRGSPRKSLSVGAHPAGRAPGVNRLYDSDGAQSASYFED